MKRRKRRTVKPQRDRLNPVSSSDQPAATRFRLRFNSYYAFLSVLAIGIVVRLVVFNYVGYFNNDNHVEVIDYIARHWSLPRADQVDQAYQPPLYYLLAAPLLRVGGLVAVQLLSLFLSIATLTLIAALLRQLPWLQEKTRVWCLALAAFHPQFILFSLFISNDTLAIFLGALIFYRVRRVQLSASFPNLAMLAVGLGLGLLTKAIFLAFVLPLVFFVGLIGRREALGNAQVITRLAFFLGVVSLLGCYKYVESLILFGSPAISNLDFGEWIKEHQPTWLGAYSLFDFNLFKLVREPVISPSTVHSYPLLIYGSFWYSLIPESTFQGNLISPINRIGSAIYVAALYPTFLMLVGAARTGIAALGFGSSSAHDASMPERTRLDYEGVVLLIFLLNLLLIVAVGWKYDVWSVFQGRLLFPSYVALLLALGTGMEWAESSRFKIILAHLSMGALIALFIFYLAVEVWLANVFPVNPMRRWHVPFKIDMNAR
jgi:4-amino-4-deoxy-L-arabinose transferase-like glycosyltransferase